MTEKTPIREITFRHTTHFFERYPEYRASTERSLRQSLIDLGLEPEDDIEERREPATEGDAFTASLPAITVLRKEQPELGLVGLDSAHEPCP